MQINEYEKNALKTFNKDNESQMLLNGVMGLAGEAGECIDLVKKSMFHKHTLDTQKLKDELGDVLWYVSLTAKAIGTSLEEIALFNLQKLEKRYPKGEFDITDSIKKVDYNNK